MPKQNYTQAVEKYFVKHSAQKPVIQYMYNYILGKIDSLQYMTTTWMWGPRLGLGLGLGIGIGLVPGLGLGIGIVLGARARARARASAGTLTGARARALTRD